ncbi:pre-mRNA-splicing factor ATP-dependent RNA helicase prp43 [Diaporthe helianthi]|uniref:Pre-mRNA-splicing factor ATP-dependent RNA helicase prp43 n=1 Tax=Diaporthe helianthi TaxID=158607 RepID=A0A2P5HQK0_DIAHE|nr:pre-mRNA-splicing factor ATP-dependent RNA helicase prp43 [Diaporthe helianthi]
MAPTLPVLNSSFKRDRVTMAQINNFENAAMNGLRPDHRAFSAKFRELLAGRRGRPVAKDTAKILAALQGNQTIVVASPTGSGKTTEIPQLAMFNELGSKFLVACTQPRRLAATSVAEFVAKQRDVELGEEVGFKVRFNNKTVPHKTRLQYMTDGMLLQEIQTDPVLSKYGCIIIDEAHERSISTDLLLPLLRVALGKRKDLKLIIMSATIDARKFCRFFKAAGGQPAPYIEVGGASYPVEILYLDTSANNSDYVQSTAWTVAHYHRTHPLKGDILAFLPGEDDLREVSKLLVQCCPDGLEVIPIHSLLSDEQQQNVFKTVEGKRKVVLATNIAETSLTIDGIACVIDCGKSKQTTFDPRMRAEKLLALPISRASAAQRAGRAGRTAPGKCYRLYTKSAFNQIMEASTIPEIKRSDLAEAVLKLMAMGYDSLRAVWDFEFVDQPDPEVLYAATQDLFAW